MAKLELDDETAYKLVSEKILNYTNLLIDKHGFVPQDIALGLHIAEKIYFEKYLNDPTLYRKRHKDYNDKP